MRNVELENLPVSKQFVGNKGEWWDMNSRSIKLCQLIYLRHAVTLLSLTLLIRFHSLGTIMTNEKRDILVEIPDQDLPLLASLYEQKAQWAPYMISFVHISIQWKKSEKFCDKIIFMSPSSWEKDGTIIAFHKCHSNNIYIFTLDDNCTNLNKALTETKLILLEKNKRTIFFCIHEKHMPSLQLYFTKNNIELLPSDVNPCYIYAMSPEEGHQLTFSCPDDVYIKKLETSAALQMDAVGPHQFPGSDQYLANFIEMNGGFGVFLKSNDEMVAWVLKHCFGHLGVLQTEEKHKRKGYGSLVAKVLAKEIAEEGHWPMGTIDIGNQASIVTFEKMGFRNIGKCTYIEFCNYNKKI